MANTYSQLYAHLIFSPLGRQNLITNNIKEGLYKYIAGIIKNKKQKPIIINGTQDHIHILVGFVPEMSLSVLVKDIKCNSSHHINKNHLIPAMFQWQKGFGAFTYHRSLMSTVASYIERQEEHHKKKTFREEYIGLLNKAGIKYDEKYLFEWYE